MASDFTDTEIYKAFSRFKQALITAWIRDTEDQYTERSRRSTKEAMNRARDMENEFLEMLEKAVKK
jgi:hypothetical protein